MASQITIEQAVELMRKHPIDDNRFNQLPEAIKGVVAYRVLQAINGEVDAPLLFKTAMSRRLGNLAHLAVAAIAYIGIDKVSPFVKTPGHRKIMHQVFGAATVMALMTPSKKEKRSWVSHDLDI